MESLFALLGDNAVWKLQSDKSGYLSFRIQYC